ncbi:iron-containing alcohol dehydrogenase [Olsenella porci]|uniref:Iron-containing alcohol dehydrogenase n=1 Tax=Olsenella porci TaxID=2652279 RepID=A0A6N7XDS8_9ACTN|nr:iron-containing alcohol dehydrogenase [Olsenella porci]MST72463.1 iron-containing alcohol dehydrogenase [Olsenella porci]
MESFVYDYPVKNYFGKGSLDRALQAELPQMGDVVMLAYGGGSLKRSGLYDTLVSEFKAAGKKVVDFGGIMSNPTYEKVQEGARLARQEDVDFILAAGGGSVFDCCKVISAQAWLDQDIDEFEHVQHKVPNEFIPMGCVVTVFGTGAEQNNGAVITNEETHVKGPFLGALPKWAVLDPAFTLTVPHDQLISGAFDTLSHCMETYFGTPRQDNVSDDMNFAVQRNIIRNMRALVEDSGNMQARSELEYDSAMAENGVLKVGKVTDFQCHMIQHQYGAYTHTNHGKGLAVIHPHVYRHLASSAPTQFARWAREVWNVQEGETDLDTAYRGIDALAAFIKEMGLPTTFAELGGDASDQTLSAVADTAILTAGCAKKLSSDELFDILAECR